jgi:hypothetical protein
VIIAHPSLTPSIEKGVDDDTCVTVEGTLATPGLLLDKLQTAGLNVSVRSDPGSELPVACNRMLSEALLLTGNASKPSGTVIVNEAPDEAA